MIWTFARVVVVSVSVSAVLGCGQKGALYLRDSTSPGSGEIAGSHGAASASGTGGRGAIKDRSPEADKTPQNSGAPQ